MANVDNIAFDVKVLRKRIIFHQDIEATVNQWTPSGKWGCYFETEWNSQGSYKWASDADFYNIIYVDKGKQKTA